MSKADAVGEVGRLISAFGATVAEDRVEVYVNELSTVPGDVLHEAVTAIIRRSKFFPSVGEILDSALAVCGLLPPSAAEIIALVRQADVREPVYRRDGSLAYTERYWRWPEGADPQAVKLAEAVLARVGEPCDEDGREHFGWDTGFQKTCEPMVQDVKQVWLADPSRLRLGMGTRLLSGGGK